MAKICTSIKNTTAWKHNLRVEWAKNLQAHEDKTKNISKIVTVIWKLHGGVILTPLSFSAQNITHYVFAGYHMT